MVTRLGIKVEHPVYIKMSMRNKSGIFPRELLFQTNLANTVHRGAFCQFPFWRIYYCSSSKSIGKETGKTHLCAVSWLGRFFAATYSKTTLGVGPLP